MITITKNYISKKSTMLLLVAVIITTLMFQQTSIAAKYNVFKGGFSSGSITVTYIDGSERLCKSAYKKWNKISSKVKLTKGNHSASRRIATSFNKIKAPTAGKLGVTHLSKGGVKVDTSSRWDTATCIQYVNSKLDTHDKRLKTCVHEIGHALSLAHPKRSVDSIMNQGVSSNNNIQGYDKSALKSKWGK